MKEEKFQVNIPNEILGIFYKTPYINKLEWVDKNYIYVIDRSLIKLNGQYVDEDTKNFYLSSNPNLALFFKEIEDNSIFSKKIYYQNIIDGKLFNYSDYLIIIKSFEKKTKYIIKFNKLLNYLLESKIVDEEFYKKFKNIGVFCIIDNYCLSGLDQDLILEEFLRYYPSEYPIIIDLLHNNLYLEIFKVVTKYLICKKNFLAVAGNSGSGNVTGYWDNEQYSRYPKHTDTLLPLMYSLKLNENFDWNTIK
jgi:hypothetical protein